MTRYQIKFKFKISDTVRIRSKPPYDITEGPTWDISMDKYCGHIGKITYRKIADQQRDSFIKIYHIEGAGSYWWDERWLVPISSVKSFLPEDLFEI